jgi:aminoglycoside phosphotransferase (APT) family kinase protein
MALRNKLDPVSAGPALAGWLTANVRGAEDVRVTAFDVPKSSGLSCETALINAEWSIDGVVDRHRLVARVASDPSDVSMKLFPDYDLELEAQVMRAVSAHTNVPAPHVSFVEPNASVLGGPFLIMERIDGRVPADDPPYTKGGWVLNLSAQEQGKLIDNTLEVFAGVHGLDWRQHGLARLDRYDRGPSGASQAIANVEHLYRTGSGGRPHPSIESGIAWAKAHQPADEGEMVLNWGDARLGNILFADDGSVAGVVDWEMANVGCRDQELGLFAMTQDLFTKGFGVPAPPGFPSEKEVVQRYEALTGHTVRNLDYFKAIAALLSSVLNMRMAYIMITEGLLPPDSPMPHSNPASQLMTEYMGLPAPTGQVTDWSGVR